MRKNGFTLIELLAVIVVLAVIALIATPMVLSTIDESKRGAAKSSGYSYVSEVETSLAGYMLKNSGESYGANRYDISKLKTDLEVEVKGDAPTAGYVCVGSNGVVTKASLKINGYVVNYDGNEATTTDLSEPEAITCPVKVELKDAGALVKDMNGYVGEVTFASASSFVVAQINGVTLKEGQIIYLPKSTSISVYETGVGSTTWIYASGYYKMTSTPTWTNVIGNQAVNGGQYAFVKYLGETYLIDDVSNGVELKDASNAIKTANNFVEGNVVFNCEDGGRVVSVKVNGNTLSLNDIIYVSEDVTLRCGYSSTSNTRTIEKGYYKATSESSPFLSNFENLGKSYLVGSDNKVELKDASDEIKTANSYIGEINQLVCYSTTISSGYGESMGWKVGAVVYVTKDLANPCAGSGAVNGTVEAGYYKVKGMAIYNKFGLFGMYDNITKYVEYLGESYEVANS